MGLRKYRYWTDEEIGNYLISLGHPLASFVTSGEVYGYYDNDGQLFVYMDDDDERVQMIVTFLRRIGARDVSP